MTRHIPKILIVEDASLVAKHIQFLLEQEGYEVVARVATGLEALECMGKFSVDLVLLDIILKGQPDGVEIAKQMRVRHKSAIIFLTAHSDEKTLERAMETEPDGFILKPFNDREFKTAVETALYKQKTNKPGTSKKSLSNAARII